MRVRCAASCDVYVDGINVGTSTNTDLITLVDPSTQVRNRVSIMDCLISIGCVTSYGKYSHLMNFSKSNSISSIDIFIIHLFSKILTKNTYIKLSEKLHHFQEGPKHRMLRVVLHDVLTIQITMLTAQSENPVIT